MKIRSRLLTRMAAAAVVLALRLLYRTCRVEVVSEAAGVNPCEDTGSRRFLYCLWHDHIAMALFTGRPRHMAGLVSRHHDGSFLAEAMRRMDIVPVRGSTSRGGAQALRELIDTARDRHVAITPDGPRGPRRELKSGIVFLASQTGRPVVPVTLACRRGWRLRGSWTDLLVPWPFTTIYACGGQPLHVPRGLDRGGLQRYVERLQSEMDGLAADADRLAAGHKEIDAIRRAA